MGSEFPIAIPYPDDSEEIAEDVENELGDNDDVIDDINETEALAAQGKYSRHVLLNYLV